MDKNESFKDIVKPPPAMVCKTWNPWIPNKLDIILNPKELQLKVLQSTRIQRLIEETAKTDNRKPEDVQNEVAKLLLEIGFTRSLPTIRSLGVILNFFITRICQGLYVNQTSVKHLKREVHGNPVLYLPSHRSYADFILMSYVCFTNQIEIPGIAAGMDFHGMAGMGEILRKTGAFFMRRSFINDKLYFTTFKEYVHKLMTIYHSGVEFFLEGTRSRSCKSLPPKIGLLSMCLEPFLMGELPDVTIVPVSISYDKPLEEQLFVYELLGVPKPKESTKGMLKAFSILSQNFGSIYFDFGQPFSVKEYLNGRVERFKHAIEPAHVQTLSKDELKVINSLAYDVVNFQQDKIIITVFNLMCFCFNFYKFKGKSLSLELLCEEITSLQRIFRTFGAHLSLNFKNKELRKEISDALQIHKNILCLKNGNLELVTSTVDFHKIDKGRMKAHKLSNKVMIQSVPIFSLQLYLNPCLHWTAPHAMIILILKKFNKPNISPDTIFPEYLRLRSLFQLEFVLHPEKAQQEFETVISHLCTVRIIHLNSNTLSLNSSQCHLADQLMSILAPFISCYLIGIDTILMEFSKPYMNFNEKQILVKVQINTESFLLQKTKHIHPYALSLDSISLLLQSLTNLGCLEKKRNGKEILFTSSIDKLNDIKDLLVNYCPILNYDYLYYTTDMELLVPKL
uniref:CSON000074 protein n=1 Tax=Culicoides sonorensis TaxID=179676 RepID=A0A336K3H7_CULSO